ncbi:MAG: threonine synthase [Mariprofundaceae bacterium]
MQRSLLVITNGLISYQDGLTLHPDLFVWQKSLANRKQLWFKTQPYNPLSMYAELLAVEPALLLAPEEPVSSAKQYWVASPYHAQLSRDSVRIMPEAMLPWCAEDAAWICELLNPLLSEEGMYLHSVGAALTLCCDQLLDVDLPTFASIAGKSLPNSHPAGADSGRMMRLMSEIQMFLNQNPAPHRLERGEGGIHGLCFWGGASAAELNRTHEFPVACRNPFLQSVVDAKDATVIMSEAEDVSQLLRRGKALPKYVLLMADDQAVILKRGLLPSFSKFKLEPKNIKSEKDLFSFLRK